MKTSYVASIALAFATLATGYAVADDASAQGNTREQVRAELLQAQRTGDIVGGGDTGTNLNELYPNRYPAKAAMQGNTREQVRAELLQAQQSGDLVANEGLGYGRN